MPDEKGMKREACSGRRRWACAPYGRPSWWAAGGKGKLDGWRNSDGWRNLDGWRNSEGGGSLSGGRVLRLQGELGTRRPAGGEDSQTDLL